MPRFTPRPLLFGRRDLLRFRTAERRRLAGCRPLKLGDLLQGGLQFLTQTAILRQQFFQLPAQPLFARPKFFQFPGHNHATQQDVLAG
jgi:hypothetical protein